MRPPNPSQRTRDGASTDAWTSLLLVLCVGLIVAAALTAQSPPRAVDATAASSLFSAERASTHLPAIASEPHPIGSAANRAVRDTLLLALDELGLQTELQRSTVVSRRFPASAIVENVLGRLPGTVGDSAVLLMAHYDSVPSAPGAADNGAAVVAILETLRALQAGSPLRNDVIVLFTDGEEVGLLGAEAFVAEHRWLPDVGMVLNFEARGSRGPSVLVETSGANGELVRAFARVDPYPNASSLASSVYDLLPNDTDFSVFKPLGLPGLNFAFIRNAAHYHTPRDTLDTLSLRSLQHHGEHMLALTRSFGDADLAALADSEGERVYVDLLRRVVLHYPAGFAMPLALLTLLVWTGVVSVARARALVRLRGVAAGVLALSLALAVAVALGSALHTLLGWLQPDLTSRWLAAPFGAETGMAGFALAALLSTLLVAQLARRWITPLALALGGALVWVGLALASASLLPGASYLPTWSVLGLLLGIGIVIAARAAPGGARWHQWVLVAGALPGLLLLAPFSAEGFVGLGLAFAAPVLVLVALGAWLLTPLLDAVRGPWPGLLPLVLLVACLGTLTLAMNRAAFGPQQPGPSIAFYAVDPERGLALFASLQDEPDAWTERFVATAPAPDGTLPALLPDAPALRHGAAPVLDLPSPRLEVLSDEVDGSARTLTLRIAAGRDASQLTLLLATPADVWGFAFEGRPVDALEWVNGWHRFVSYGPMHEGVVVRFSVAAGAPLEAVLIDRTHDLLDHVALGVPARPADLMAAPTRVSDAVMVIGRSSLD